MFQVHIMIIIYDIFMISPYYFSHSSFGFKLKCVCVINIRITTSLVYVWKPMQSKLMIFNR